MITFTLILLDTTSGKTDRITAEHIAIPCVHEFVFVAGKGYRVEDVSHDIEKQTVEVRAVG